jgi:hypothetical protein
MEVASADAADFGYCGLKKRSCSLAIVNSTAHLAPAMFHQVPEKAKPGAALIRMRGIKYQPILRSSDKVPQMPLGINEATD